MPIATNEPSWHRTMVPPTLWDKADRALMKLPVRLPKDRTAIERTAFANQYGDVKLVYRWMHPSLARRDFAVAFVSAPDRVAIGLFGGQPTANDLPTAESVVQLSEHGTTSDVRAATRPAK